MLRIAGILCLLVLITACTPAGDEVENNYKNRTLKSGAVISTNPSVLGNYIAEKAIQLAKDNKNKSSLNIPQRFEIPIIIIDPSGPGFGHDDSPFTRPDIKHPLEDFDVCWMKHEGDYMACAPSIPLPLKDPFERDRD